MVAGDAVTAIWHRGALIGGKVADSISEYVDQVNSQNYAPHNKCLRHIISVPVTRPSILYITPHSVFQVFFRTSTLIHSFRKEFITFFIPITLISHRNSLLPIERKVNCEEAKRKGTS